MPRRLKQIPFLMIVLLFCACGPDDNLYRADLGDVFIFPKKYANKRITTKGWLEFENGVSRIYLQLVGRQGKIPGSAALKIKTQQINKECDQKEVLAVGRFTIHGERDYEILLERMAFKRYGEKDDFELMPCF